MTSIIEMRISNIKIGHRFRRDMGDLQALAESMIQCDLLQPIGITPNHDLVFGERRLRTIRDILGRKTIMARIVDVPLLLGQFDENLLQKEFTITERIAIVESLPTFEHGGDRRSDQIRNCEVEKLAVEDACIRAGFSKDSFYRAKKVAEQGIPELVQAMDSGAISIYAAETLAKASAEEQRICLTKRFAKGGATARSIEKQLRRIRNHKQRESDLARVIGSPKFDEDIQIYHCPFQELEQRAGIQPDSAPLMLTDIPYGNDFVDQIDELGAFAERVLIPGGTLVAYVGQYQLNRKLELLDRHLKYQWLGTSVWNGEGTVAPRLKVVSKCIPIVIYSKDNWEPRTRWVDTWLSGGREKDWHRWQRPLAEIEKLISYFSRPGDLVVDPCAGGFTTAIACHRNRRRFVGCDIDQAAVAKGQERLSLERRPEANLLLTDDMVMDSASVRR